MTDGQHPHFVQIGPDPDFARTVARCVDLRDRHFCPAQSAEIGLEAEGDALQFVILGLSRGRIGLHVCLTPAGAREMANSLLECAKDLETQLATRAAAQLAATFAKDPNA